MRNYTGNPMKRLPELKVALLTIIQAVGAQLVPSLVLLG